MRALAAGSLLIAALAGLAVFAPGAILAQTCAAATQCVTYDALGRVTSVTTPDGNQTIYSYDAAGNRTSVVVSGSVKTPPTAPDETVPYTFPQSAPVITPSLGAHVSIVGVTPAQLGTTSSTSTQLTYTPPTTVIVGADHFGYEVQDSTTGLTASALVTVNLASAAPIANPASIALAENGNLQFTPSYSDPNHLTVTITGVSTPTNGTAVINGGTSITYTPTSGFWCAKWPQSCDTFTYTVTNSSNLTATATVTATVTATPPTANGVAIGVGLNQPQTFDPRSSDSDPQGLPLSVTAVGAPSHGTAALNNNLITYTPSTGYTGTDSFSYTIANSGGGSASATVTATIGAALAVSLSKTTWRWLKTLSNTFVAGAVIAQASGGQAPYTYAWQWNANCPNLSALNATATAPNWLSTQWTASVPQDNTEYCAEWVVKATDALNHTVTSAQVTVTFEWDNHD
ncbi:MAG TPA: Ig-like domain-containing protein [Caulobacteraceae bacterium]|nr:Ig-like domain-containing protein [Caulobacteraceae bacterium]